MPLKQLRTQLKNNKVSQQPSRVLLLKLSKHAKTVKDSGARATNNVMEIRCAGSMESRNSWLMTMPDVEKVKLVSARDIRDQKEKRS